ncbi:hypothetical protein K469DRAFT_690109 [Zopfia rhizophila CBS 207.26]|uniref:Uncharacterized protein n=1 Tax=Zopfia rhizophila CBS 207.26 TaxID=1314779 RepID=A0A6A6DZI2_9PEZI|nr:hypothetical protein K469DRAFT_690109 [Zopfia rhizophila CBS 207.26]
MNKSAPTCYQESRWILWESGITGLKVVNGASYEVLDVILKKAYPGHRINADTILHFGLPAGILLAAELMRDFHFVGMPLSRCRSLDGIMLISKARERDFVGNKVPESMIAAEERLELLSEATIREAESRDWTGK